VGNTNGSKVKSGKVDEYDLGRHKKFQENALPQRSYVGRIWGKIEDMNFIALRTFNKENRNREENVHTSLRGGRGRESNFF